ncbi:MAG: hypothetical protein HKO59_04300 [Phycisphaerales bacterium]|nr:NHL repeat-containing protein [Phycisphaerae bacterium]NNF42371.1 hypothetical protein [Phycisphaerales bacterium]NNM25198.1 hypothetical protein [Phycisphaerales bacterium]
MRQEWILGAVLLGATATTHADQVLVCGWNTSNVVRCDTETGACEAFVGTGSGGLASPHSLAIGPDGNLYVTSFSNGRVLQYRLENGGFLDTFVPAGAGGLGAPTDGNFGPDGNLYVTSFATDCVLRYDGKTGDFIDVFVSSGSGGLLNPEALDFGPDGHLYVVSGNNRNVLRYDGVTGAFLGVFVPTGSGGILDPHFICFHEKFLYLTAFGNNKVVRYDARTGVFVDVFIQDDPATPDIDESGGLASAHGLRFGPDGNLYVASFGNHRVLRYDGASGDFIDEFIPAGSGITGPIDILFLPPECPADLDGSGDVGFTDLLAVLAAWGPCVGACPADLDESGDVGFTDLLAVLASWGPC